MHRGTALAFGIVLTACASESSTRFDPPRVAAQPPTKSESDAASEAPDAGAGVLAAPSEPAEALPEPPPSHPFHQPLPPPEVTKDSPAARSASLSSVRCFAEVKKRALAVKRAKKAARGVGSAMRLAGSIRGIRFVAPGPKSPYGLFDCRLALVLDDLAAVLERHGVVAIQVDNFYRPRSHLPGRKRTASQHAHGLAMDVTRFSLRDGRTLIVERDWHGAIGAASCGPNAAPDAPTEETIALRNLICEIGREQVFHHVLTPSFDAAHRDHVHMDIKRDNPTSHLR